jgi:hypothetical protein
MNNKSMKRSGLLMISLFCISLVSYSQFKDVDFLRSAPADGAKYIQSYLTPWANAFGAGLNGGWYNTAKPHKFGGFDITTNFSVGMVPTSAETFDVTKIGLSSALSVSGTGLASTAAGPKTSTTQMSLKDPSGVTLASFGTPKGSALKFIPVPMAQVGLGLPLGTELKFRFIPKISIGDGNISLWGVGLFHSLVQYLPGSKLLPFDVSLFGGYTKLTSNIPISLQPDATVAQNFTAPYSSVFAKQNLNFSVSALNISLIASLNLPVVTLYGGLGYCKDQTAIKVQGDFPTPVLVATPSPHAEYNNSGVKKGSDFPKIDIKDYSGLRANIGLRIKLAVITIHADYTKAQYNVYSAGLGVSFR